MELTKEEQKYNDKIVQQGKDIQAEMEAMTAPFKKLLEELYQQQKKLSYAPIYRAIDEGKRLGRRWHSCSLWTEFDPYGWEKHGWKSLEHWVESVGADWYTDDPEKIQTHEEIWEQ